MSDDLYLAARGRRISGWTDVSVTLRADGFPGRFEIKMTWRDPVTKGAVIAAAGDECEIYLGSDLVITGYIDEDIGGGDKDGRSLTLTGRGKCQDLVDCSAEWPSGQLIGGDAVSIATKLAQPYGISVALANGATAGPQVPAWALNYTETPEAIIQRLAQNAGLLAYEDNAGRLVLATVGGAKASTGVVYGENVERWQIEHSMHERFSDVVCFSLGTAALGDLAGNDFFDTEKDPNVPRHRQMDVILAEVAEPAQEFTIRKAKWEITRRAGRSTIVSATLDSWRDGSGTLWAPNTLVPVSLPDNRVPGGMLLLANVTFRRDASGTHADLELMPKEAFALEPINLLPINVADLVAAPSQ